MSQVLEDMQIIDLDINLEDIKYLSKTQFQKMVRMHIKCFTLNTLLEDTKEGKGQKLKYEQNYFLSPDLTIEEKQWIFKCRSNEIDIKANKKWKHTDISCISCKNPIPEDENHLIECLTLLGKNENISYIPNFIDMFEDDLEEQIYIARLLKENFETRKNYL